MSHVQLTPIANFAIHYLQFLNENGELTQASPIDDATLLMLYEKMWMTRLFDTKAVNLQRTGQLGTYPQSQGQEAIGVGLGYAMEQSDVFCPYYRDHGTFLMRGIDMADIYAYWGGDERGSLYAGSDAQEDFPICVPIASQALHAAGVAYAMKYRQEKRVAVTTCGEGGTSKGDFYEAINLAAAWKLPVVFMVNNNQWAISTPRTEQTACQTIAQKAIAAGCDGIQIDGNDIIAVSHAVKEALEKARRGEGPTVIEAMTFRLCDHTTADDAKRYMPEHEFKAASQYEPLKRLKHYLEQKKLWSEEKEQALKEKLGAEIETIVARFLSRPKAKATDMFDNMYATLPPGLQAQRAEVEALQYDK
jgi:2-oxoisovalerate dehydrogenase E1 component alpha subunit